MRNCLTLSALRLVILLAPVAPFLEAGTNPATITVNVTPTTWADQTQPLSVQVTVTGASGPGSGSIKLKIDNTADGNVITLNGGSASFSIPDPTHNITSSVLQTPGTHGIGVDYVGDSNYLSQGYNANYTTIKVTGPTSTDLSARSSTQLVIGQPVVLIATVTAGATGTVTFLDNGSAIATLPLSGNQAVMTQTLSLGFHPIVAQYSGDANFSPSTSSQVTVTVSKANTTTALTSPPNNSAATAGTTVTLTAQVAVQSPGVASVTGTVQFLDNGVSIATKTLAGGTASFSVSSLPQSPVPHSFTAVYAGNGNLNASTSAPVSFTVNGLPTNIATPTASGNSAVGQQFTITTTVTGPSGAGTPTGFVTFADGTTTIGTIALDSTGMASLSLKFQSAGTHFIFATYGGDAKFAASPTSSVLSVSICPNNPTVTVTASVASPVFGQTVIFTGSVSPAAPGSMDFLADGQSMLAALPITLVNGQAQFAPDSSSPLQSGAHTITVSYYCGTGFTGISSDRLNLIVNSDSSTTNLRVSGQNGLQLTAVVLPNAPGFGTPTGTVQFLNGSTILGAVQLDTSSGIATATFLASSSGSVVAHYSGDANFFASDSTPVTISTLPTSLTLTSSANPAKLGDKITFTATVTNGSGSATPTGTVDFFDGTAPLASGVPISSKGQATCSAATLTAGSHVITAQYNATGVFQTAQASLGQYVAPGGTGGGGGGGGSTIAASAFPQSAVYGQAVTLTATVTPTGSGTPPVPTGQVTFQNGSTVLGTAPVGQGLTLNSLSLGSYNVTASYAGDNVYSPSQATVSFVVAQAATKTAYAPTLNQSGQAKLTATVTVVAPGAGTPTGTVQFMDASSNNLTITTATLAGGIASAIVDASIATHQIVAVYNGDTNFAGSSSASQLQLVSTAANITSSFAPDEAVSAYHVTNLTGDTTADVFPLSTSMGGASVKITDSTGVSWLSPLYGVFASASQINFVMPGSVSLGPALVTALLPGNHSLMAVANITQTSPAIFTANMNGQGVAAGQFVHVHPGFVQSFDNIAVFDTKQNKYVPNPVSMGPDTDQLYLVLYGTGIRHRASDDAVVATVNGVNVPIKTAAQGVYPGLDQMNLQLPRSLAGAGTADVIITVAGQMANTVQIAIQ